MLNIKRNKRRKIAIATLFSASLAFLISSYILNENDTDESVDESDSDSEDESDIFENVDNWGQIHKIWLEYNRRNHPDKFMGNDIEKHMTQYYKVKEKYEELEKNLKSL